jgi:Replication initiator protein, pSAM2
VRPAPVGWCVVGFPGVGEHAPLDLDLSDPRLQRQLLDLARSGRLGHFADVAARVGNCARPIRLAGASERIDAVTGEVLRSYSSASEPLGSTYVRCGNRRAAECLSCSRLYAGDLFQLIRCGVSGGKTVPETVADNPLVFATLTAPSFGRVHGPLRAGGHCGRAKPGRRCRHGRHLDCPLVHGDDDELLGQPLCPECYDYPSHIVWQWWAPELWRRFTTRLRRLLAHSLGVPESRLPQLASLQYAKVAEYQRRGVIHFHVLIRLDGPRSPAGLSPAPAAIDRSRLARIVRTAAETAWLIAPGVDHNDPRRRIVFGAQHDVRPVRNTHRTDEPDQPLRPDQVAGYLAKYATKSASDTGPGPSAHGRRIRALVLDYAARARDHALATGTTSDYQLLGKWVHMLGFRGHFSSRSRRYSITLGALRRARRRASILIAQAAHDGRTLDLAALEADLLADDDSDTTLVVGHWHYLGSGWENDAERALAIAAAARAREHDQWQAEQRRSTTHQDHRN